MYSFFRGEETAILRVPESRSHTSPGRPTPIEWNPHPDSGLPSVLLGLDHGRNLAIRHDLLGLPSGRTTGREH